MIYSIFPRFLTRLLWNLLHRSTSKESKESITLEFQISWWLIVRFWCRSIIGRWNSNTKKFHCSSEISIWAVSTFNELKLLMTDAWWWADTDNYVGKMRNFRDIYLSSLWVYLGRFSTHYCVKWSHNEQHTFFRVFDFALLPTLFFNFSQQKWLESELHSSDFNYYGNDLGRLRWIIMWIESNDEREVLTPGTNLWTIIYQLETQNLTQFSNPLNSINFRNFFQLLDNVPSLAVE